MGESMNCLKVMLIIRKKWIYLIYIESKMEEMKIFFSKGK